MPTIIVDANENEDDCLAAAADAYIADHPSLRGYNLEPRWRDEDRDAVLLTVPAWSSWSPSAEQRAEVTALDFGEVDQYYSDTAEIERKREDWDADAESWADEIKAALDAKTYADRDDHLATASQIESEWGDDPTTDLACKILRDGEALTP